LSHLTKAARDALPDNAFGLPGIRAYPMPAAVHARNAKARAVEDFNYGNLTALERALIDEKANHIPGQK